ncbi:MAG: hypothetical protein IPK97_02375 [Ahniella sp.]|nr:hypothetical protein [Ahniella sp.]
MIDINVHRETEALLNMFPPQAVSLGCIRIGSHRSRAAESGNLLKAGVRRSAMSADCAASMPSVMKLWRTKEHL